MSTLPLITHAEPHAAFAWRGDRLISAGQFLHAATTLSSRLPAGRHALNLCTDRYCFAVALAAALLRGDCTLLPAAQAPEGLRELRRITPELYCVADASVNDVLLAALRCPVVSVDAHLAAAGDGSAWPVPHIGSEQACAILFTSGSTGTPVPHARNFQSLVRCVRAEAERLAPVRAGACAILGTVPAQHSYGFESTVLLPFQSAGVLCASRPLFPADIAATLHALPRPRLLCTTPVHLRALLDTQVSLPALDLLLCATAPLSAELAQAAEQRYGAPLVEIYGSTETGQIASRRTLLEPAWQLWPGVQLRCQEQRTLAQGGHLAQLTALADLLEPLDAQRFLLHGRNTDLVNVAGKRSSLAYLSHQLNAVPGVLDGAFFVREEARASVAGVTRLAAFAVTQQLSAAHILSVLRERIDPAFLPRPLLLVERLPRNETGKLPHRSLHDLAEALAAERPALFE